MADLAADYTLRPPGYGERMRCFLSYARDDGQIAKQISVRLRGDGHRCFFDEISLAPGELVDARIRQEIRKADLFVFLISPRSVTKRYTLTELDLASKIWPSPRGHVLPVMIEETPRESIPPYLEAIQFLRITGNLPADVARHVEELHKRRRGRTAIVAALGVIGVGVGVAVGAGVGLRAPDHRVRDPVPISKPPPDNTVKPPTPTPEPTPAFFESRKKLPSTQPIAPSRGKDRVKKPIGEAEPAPTRPRDLDVVLSVPTFFDRALMMPDLVEADRLAHQGRWKAAHDALRRVSSGRSDPKLWLAHAQLYAQWNYPSYRGDAEAEISRAERGGLPPELAQVAESIRRTLERAP